MTGPLARIAAAYFALLMCAGTFATQALGWDNDPKGLWHMCTQCHGSEGQGNQLVGAPSIAGLPEWYVNAQLDKFHDGARATNPKDINGMRMRPVGRTLDESNRKVVAQYVATLARPAAEDTVTGNLVKGEQKYQVCQACHGPKAEGNVELHAPPLVNASDWYLVTQLHNFKNKVRGYNPAADPNGAAMQGMASTLDDEGMRDVIAYINTFKSTK